MPIAALDGGSAIFGLLFSHPNIFLFAHTDEPVKADLITVRANDVTFESAYWAMITCFHKNQIEIYGHILEWRKV